MKILKTLGIVVLVLIATYALWNASIDSEYNVHRTVNIEATPEVISATVSDFTTWPSWSIWFERDSAMIPTFGDITSGEGATYSWISETQGSGNMTILTYESGKSMTSQINFDGQGSSNGYWRFTPLENGTTDVTWGFKGKMPFLMRWMAAAMETWVGPDFEGGLNNLKVLIEAAENESVSSALNAEIAKDAILESLK